MLWYQVDASWRKEQRKEPDKIQHRQSLRIIAATRAWLLLPSTQLELAAAANMPSLSWVPRLLLEHLNRQLARPERTSTSLH